MERQIIALDSQILNTFQACPRKAKYMFIDRFAPMQKAEALDKGGLLHEVLKVHYLAIQKNYERILKLPSFGSEDETLNQLELVNVEKSSTLNLAKKHYNYIMTTLDLPVETCEEVWKTYLEYAQYYANDGWVPLEVENSFSKILFESDEVEIYKVIWKDGKPQVIRMTCPITILYEGITDLVTQNLVIDHKSSSRRGEPLSLSNQFIGYAWALGISTVVINKVGFQKTLKPPDKFERYTKSYPNDAIAEWCEKAITSALELCLNLNNLDSMEADFNLTSCDKYGGCLYALGNPGPCETERAARRWKLETNYKIAEEWSPAKELEK